MSLHEVTPGPSTKGPDPEVIRVLLQVCEDLQADEVERAALFRAAIVASKLRNDPDASDDRLGVLGQNPFWGPAPARRDPYTAADVFLREARRRRPERTSAAKLAALVQGGSVRRYALAKRKADRIIAAGALAQSSTVIAG